MCCSSCVQLLCVFSFSIVVRSEFRRYPFQIEQPFGHDGNKITVYWKPDFDSQTVNFLLYAEVKDFDWLIFGFSDQGKYEGSDVCVVVPLPDAVKIADGYVTESGTIKVDEQQDWRLGSFEYQEGTVFYTEISRAFDTCDKQDITLDNGTTLLLLAYGTGEFVDFQSSNVNKHIVPTRVLKEQAKEIPMPKDTMTMDITTNNVEIPAEETTYWCAIQKLPVNVSFKHHIFKYEPLITKGNEMIVHHLEVFHCETEPDVVLDYSGPCDSADLPTAAKACAKVLAAWAMGAEPLAYPVEAGLPFGGRGYAPYVRLELHYSNSKKQTGIWDNSGVRFHYSQTLRPYDAGIMELGVEYTNKMAIPGGETAFPLTGYCIPKCTNQALPENGITIFASQLHAHLTAHHLLTRHIRHGVEQPILNEDHHFVTHFQEIRNLPVPRRVMPGDSLITTCFHNTSSRNEITFGGLGIKEEMCVNYVHYYPRTNLEVCKSSIDSTYLNGYFEYLTQEGVMTYVEHDVVQNYRAVEWNQEQVEQLQLLYERGPLSMQCNQSNGMKFLGHWENQRIPTVILPLSTESDCANT